MYTFVVVWRYVDHSYTEVQRTFLCSARNTEHAISIVKVVNDWNHDKECNSTFSCVITKGFVGCEEIGGGGGNHYDK